MKIMPALILDLDGTVRRSKTGGFIAGPNDIELIPGIEDRIWEVKNQGYLVFGASNQGGVAHRIKSEMDVRHEMEKTISLFFSDPFNFIFWCCNHPDGSVPHYSVRSLLRKPGIGMLVVFEHYTMLRGSIAIDWDKSLMAGDRPEDEQCAKNAGIMFVDAEKFLKGEFTLPERSQ